MFKFIVQMFPLVFLVGLWAPSAEGRRLVLPDYPASRLEGLLKADGATDGPIFRNFLAEVVFACAVSRGDTSRRAESVAQLKEVFACYPEVVGWMNGGLERIAHDAKVSGLLGDVQKLQAGVDSLLCSYLNAEKIAAWVGPQYEVGQILRGDVDLCKLPAVRYVALSILERVCRDAGKKRRLELIEKSLDDRLFAAMVDAVNGYLQDSGRLNFTDRVDFAAITAGMPEKYAEFLNLLLPQYYAKFRDKHLLLIYYLMAEPERRISALFQASGPALQKLFQMIGDYSNDEGVKKQLNELKSGVQSYGELDMRDMVEPLLKRSVSDSVYKRLEVDYDALGSGTVAQAHRVRIKDESGARQFVIKVKRPGLKEAVESEMAVVEQIASTGFAKKLVRDLRATLEREMNLGNEAVEIRAAKVVYRHPRIEVVDVIDFVMPSDSLIAFAFAQGRTLDHVNEKLEAVQSLVKGKRSVNRPVANQYAANLLSAQSRAVYELLEVWFDEALFGGGFFHGDLHSGNIFMQFDEGEEKFKERFRKNYRLTLIDFGNTGRFTREQQRGAIKFGVAVAKGMSESVLDALVETGTVLEEDKGKLQETVNRIMASREFTTAEKIDRIATMAYAEGGASTRDLLSFIRGRVLLETQLYDLNRRLDEVDPACEYKRYRAVDAYRAVVRRQVKWHCVRSLFGLKWRGNRLITCGEARALKRAGEADRVLMRTRDKSGQMNGKCVSK